MDPRKEISMELEYLVRQRKSLTLDLEIYEYNEIQGTLPPLYPRTGKSLLKSQHISFGLHMSQ